MPTRGALIAIEGLDRAGKSTQCDILLKRLEEEGIKARLQKFPDRGTPIGQTINSYLQNSSSLDLDNRAIHLLFSANRWELCEPMKNDIQSSNPITLILDRYVPSGIVFSAAKGLSIPWCRAPDIGLPRPDIVIFLSLTPEEQAARKGFGDERYEQTEMQNKVRGLFEQLIKEDDGQAEKEDELWWVVDASESVEQVAAKVWEGVKKGLERAEKADEIHVYS